MIERAGTSAIGPLLPAAGSMWIVTLLAVMAPVGTPKPVIPIAVVNACPAVGEVFRARVIAVVVPAEGLLEEAVLSAN